MAKTDKNFVKKNKSGLIKNIFENAKRLFRNAKDIRNKEGFCSSLFLSISALEELAKWHFLKQKNINYSELEKITDHNYKIDEMLKIFREISGNNQFKKEESAWLKNNRIKEMREDILYVRLKPRKNEKNYPIFPREEYCQKRAKAIITLLEKIFEYYKTLKISNVPASLARKIVVATRGPIV